MSTLSAPLSPAEAREACNEQVARTTRPLLAALAFVLIAFAVATPFLSTRPSGLAISAAEVILALVFLGASRTLRDPRAARYVHPALGMLSVLALGTVIVAYEATGNALLTTGVVLLIMGAGVIALSWPWLLSILAIYNVGWLALLRADLEFEAWQQMLFTLIATDTIAIMAHAARYRTHLDLVRLRRQEARQRRELEESLRALHSAERRLRSVVASAPVVVLATDALGNIALAEGHGLAARGWEPVRIIGRPAQEVLAPFPDENAAFLNALSGQVARATSHDGSHTFETFWAPIVEAGRVEGVIAVATDVTERVRAEAEARKVSEQARAIERLQEMDRFKTSILNTASHELNTPLTPIKLQLHLLKGNTEGMTERQQRAVALLDRNVDRLSMLVADIMDVARLEGGQLRLILADADVAALAREAGASYADVAASREIELRVLAPESLVLRADGKRVLQVLYNLLGNALKFTPSGGSVTLRVVADADAVRVSVEDTGDGLSAEQIARLFRPFSQVHDLSRTSHAGTGLGLYISRGIALQHGGELTCESEGPGKGATFTLTLPLKA